MPTSSWQDGSASSGPSASEEFDEAATSSGLKISVSSLARRLGVASSTLRTWERRYGIGPSEHRAGRHRRYTTVDVARLECMQQALVDGATPAEAARFAINLTATKSSESAHPEYIESNVNSMKQIANSCGNGLESREMAAALLAKDAFALQCLIVESIVDHGVPRTWRSVLRPLMDWSVSSGVDNVSEDSRMAPENSRMLTHCITSAMAVTMIESPAPNNMTRVVLTTVTGGSFDLEVRALGAALARESVDVAMVPGPDTIGPHAASIAALDAGVVVVWSTDPNDAVVPLLRAIRRRRPALQIFVAGRTSTAETLPRTVELLGGMESAVEAVVGAVTSEAGT